MKNQQIAKIYAQTILQISKASHLSAADELMKVTEVINSSNELENVLFLDVFTLEEKSLVLEDIGKKISLSPLILNCLLYLIQERRIGLLPSIFKEIMVIDDEEKGFLSGVIEGGENEISSEMKSLLMNQVEKYLIGKKIKLIYKKNPEISSGFKVTAGDMQLDATLDTQLENFKHVI